MTPRCQIWCKIWVDTTRYQDGRCLCQMLCAKSIRHRRESLKDITLPCKLAFQAASSLRQAVTLPLVAPVSVCTADSTMDHAMDAADQHKHHDEICYL
eukprot:1743013-Amphidinium_carterae.1